MLMLRLDWRRLHQVSHLLLCNLTCRNLEHQVSHLLLLLCNVSHLLLLLCHVVGCSSSSHRLRSGRLLSGLLLGGRLLLLGSPLLCNLMGRLLLLLLRPDLR